MPRKDAGISIGLVGPTSLIGKELLRMLPKSGLPHLRVSLLSGEETRVEISEHDGQAQIVEALSEETVGFLDAALFCESNEILERALPWLTKMKIMAIDVQGRSEREGFFRTAVAGVSELPYPSATLYRNPHPATVLIATVLKNLLPLAPLNGAHAVVILPASSRGEEGIEELCKQTVGLLNMTGMPLEVFGRQIAFNIIPSTDNKSITEENAIAKEIENVLPHSPSFKSVTFLEAPLFHSLSILLVLQSAKKMDYERLSETLSQTKGIDLCAKDKGISSIDIGEREDIIVSLLPLSQDGKTCRMWIIGDHVKRGSCLNAIGLLESYFKAVKKIAS